MLELVKVYTPQCRLDLRFAFVKNLTAKDIQKRLAISDRLYFVRIYIEVAIREILRIS